MVTLPERGRGADWITVFSALLVAVSLLALRDSAFGARDIDIVAHIVDGEGAVTRRKANSGACSWASRSSSSPERSIRPTMDA